MARTAIPVRLEEFVEAAYQAGEQENWLAALALALTLPDICAAVDDPGRGKSEKRYAAWWDQYVANRYWVTPDPGEDWIAHSYLPGLDAYYLRCSYLHAGTDTLDGKAPLMNRVQFRGPDDWPRFGLDESSRTLFVPVNVFVHDVCRGVMAWLGDRANDPEAQQRLNGLVSILPTAVTLVRADGSRVKWTGD